MRLRIGLLTIWLIVSVVKSLLPSTRILTPIDPSPDPAILANVNIWLSLYLHFARHGNSDTVMASHPVHEQFWNNFSDTILALMTKR